MPQHPQVSTLADTDSTAGDDFFLRAHLRENPDSRARMAYFLYAEHVWSKGAIARKLRINPREIDDMIALGEKLVPDRRRG
jgi:hypothetical protein